MDKGLGKSRFGGCMNIKEIIEGLKDLQMHSGNIVFSYAIQALENKPSIEEIRKEVELEYMRGMTGGYKNIDIISNIATAIYNFRRGK